jgi:hypothetical protein
MLEVTAVEYLAEYRLHVQFSDGEQGIVDLSDSLWGPVFEPLRNLEMFQRFEVSPVIHAIRWENDADFAPEFLHEKMHAQRQTTLHRGQIADSK